MNGVFDYCFLRWLGDAIKSLADVLLLTIVSNNWPWIFFFILNMIKKTKNLIKTYYVWWSCHQLTSAGVQSSIIITTIKIFDLLGWYVGKIWYIYVYWKFWNSISSFIEITQKNRKIYVKTWCCCEGETDFLCIFHFSFLLILFGESFSEREY